MVGLAIRADWARMPELLLSDSALDALRLSLETAAISTLLCILFGGPLAVVLARGRLRGLPVLRSVVLLPLVLPPVVGGLALLFLLGRTGLLGRGLDLWFGITIPFTTAAVVLAQTFVALPFLVVSLEGALRVAGQRYEAVAATLGASPALAFRRVTVPLVLPGLRSGRGAGVRPLHGRVRRHDRVRRQPAGHHPDPAAAGLPGAGVRCGRRGGAVAAAGRGGRAGDRGGPAAHAGGLR